MAYLVKRYANRKLYDTRTKRYMTLDEISVLVRAGEDVKVEDADTSEDITGQVLSKIIAEAGRKGGTALVPQRMLIDLIQRPGETVLGAVRDSVTAGQRTVEQVSGEVGRFIDSVTGRGQTAKKADAHTDPVTRAVDDRLRAILAELDLARRSDIEAIVARLAAIESALEALKPGGGARRRAPNAAKSSGGRAPAPARRAKAAKESKQS